MFYPSFFLPFYISILFLYVTFYKNEAIYINDILPFYKYEILYLVTLNQTYSGIISTFETIRYHFHESRINIVVCLALTHIDSLVLKGFHSTAERHSAISIFVSQKG